MKRGKRTSYKKIFLVILFLAIGSVLFLYSDKTAQGAVTIGGDVYSGGDLKNTNITVNGNGVVSANGTIVINSSGNNYKIEHIKSDVDLNNVDKIIPKLKTLAAQPISNISGNFALNKNGFPEGTVWVASNGLTIDKEVIFSGKGTIIVENGNLKINGDIKYDPNDKNSSVGFIVKGDIDIDIAPNVQNLCGAYFATGTIKIK